MQNINLASSEENRYESTYALLVRSEEKSRSLLESAVYLLVVFSAMLSIWQFAQQSVAAPVSIAQTGSAHAPVVQRS